MISYFDPNGLLTPIRFHMLPVENQKAVTIQFSKITIRDEEKLAGNQTMIYKYQSTIGDAEKVYELKYELSICKWYLYKMFIILSIIIIALD